MINSDQLSEISPFHTCNVLRVALANESSKKARAVATEDMQSQEG